MCDFSGKLIAWLDRELAVGEAAEVKRHLETCSNCRSEVETYKRITCEFDAYCEEAFSSNVRRGTLPWVPALCAVGAVATLVALFVAWPRMPAETPIFPVPESAVLASPAVVAHVL